MSRRRALTDQDLAALSRPKVKRAPGHRTAQAQRAAQRPRSPLESSECLTFIAWTKLVYFDDEPLFERVAKIANERGKAGVAVAKLVAMGLRPGFPDYVIHAPVIATPQYVTRHGLYLEGKRVTGGKIDPEQDEWRRRLVRWGYHAEICAGALAMIEATRRYMNLTGASASGRFVDRTRITA